MPRTLDGAPAASFMAALLIDLGLLGLFAVQHSVMARPTFKRWFTKWIPDTAERSTYVLLSSLALIAMFAWWQPLGGVVWNVTDATLRGVLWGGFAFGWLLVLLSTFLINHFDLFGLRQVWLQLLGRPYAHLAFRTPGPYWLVRHPLYLGWLFAFWATPAMTISHLVFAIATTAYILIAIQSGTWFRTSGRRTATTSSASRCWCQTCASEMATKHSCADSAADPQWQRRNAGAAINVGGNSVIAMSRHVYQ